MAEIIRADQFVELDRRFHDFSTKREIEDVAYLSYMESFLGKSLRLKWADILASRVVVILGESGSGKTWELRYRAEKVRLSGEASFFVRLDQLVETKLDEAIAPDLEDDFQRWKKGLGSGVFFLDSVDEAKFRKQQDFETALENFVRGVGSTRIKQVGVIISSRISDWQVYTDRQIVARLLKAPIPPRIDEKKEQVESIPEYRIVQIEPLDNKQVNKFAVGLGMKNTTNFIEALDTHHAWEFARRPIDVVDLINYWTEHGKFGTLSEMIEFDLLNKLPETKERENRSPLGLKQARVGAGCLGAAISFCRRFTFSLPDSFSHERTGDSMVAADCLPQEWKANEINSFLSRPIFDSASYGRIRFHHRRVAEYLAAFWLEDRMNNNCPYPILENLLFKQTDGRMVMRRSLKPVTAFLAGGDKPWSFRVREQILTSSPNLFLSHGDPGSLPVEYRRSLLRSLVSFYSERNRVWLETDTTVEALSRMAHPDLSPDISDLLLSNSTIENIRVLLLNLIRFGKLCGCVDAALKIVESFDEGEHIKNHAVAVIRDIGGEKDRDRLLKAVQGLDSIGMVLASRLCEALYPHVVNEKGLADLLRKVREVPRNTVGLPFYLKELLQSHLPKDRTSDMLGELLELLQQAPYIQYREKETPISAQYYWIGEVIPAVLMVLIKLSSLNKIDVERATKALWLLGKLKRIDRVGQDLSKELNELLAEHPAVRREFLWFRVEELQFLKPGSEVNIHRIFDHYEILEQKDTDLEWLIQDIQTKESEEQRSIALKLSAQIWWYTGQDRSSRIRIRSAVAGDQALSRLFKKEFRITLKTRCNRLYYKYKLYDLKRKIRRAPRSLNDKWIFIKDLIWFWRNLRKLRDGSAVYPLSELARRVARNGKWGVNDWRPLIKKWGMRIAKSVATGWKNSWRNHKPLLPYQKDKAHETDRRVIIGLCGIGCALADGDLNFNKMGDDEVRLASRYAVNEMNGFPAWFSDMVFHHQDVVLETLRSCIQGEWKITSGKENFSEVIHKLRYDQSGVAELVVSAILDELKKGDPLHPNVLEDALAIELQFGNVFYEELSTLASFRAPSYGIDASQYMTWLIVWLQLSSETAIQHLKKMLSETADPNGLMVSLCSFLDPRHGFQDLKLANPDYGRPKALKEFIPLVYRYVKPEDDIDRTRGGAYTPTARDNAQDFRGSLFGRLSKTPGKKAFALLRSLSQDSQFERYRDWIFHLIEEREEQDADLDPWIPTDIPVFMEKFEKPPHSDHDLYSIACNRFLDIRDEVERGQISSRADLHSDSKESDLRSWLARQLAERSGGHYTIPQEVEIDSGKPDLRMEAPRLTAVPIEIKWADKWTFKQLKEGLIDQLVGKYMRAPNSCYGIYCMGYIGRKDYWEDTETGDRLSFKDLTQRIADLAKSVLNGDNEIDGLIVYGIDFRKPTP